MKQVSLCPLWQNTHASSNKIKLGHRRQVDIKLYGETNNHRSQKLAAASTETQNEIKQKIDDVIKMLNHELGKQKRPSKNVMSTFTKIFLCCLEKKPIKSIIHRHKDKLRVGASCPTKI